MNVMRQIFNFVIKVLLRILESIVFIIVLSLALLLGIFDRIESLIKKLQN